MNIEWRKRYAALVLLLCVSVSHAEEASEVTNADRPRIGLVLGGGGARGAAHIGVLRELERLRIPIDAIAGTSVGAIIGGLYASGMTVPELEELIASLDWDEAFTDGSNRDSLRYRRKQDDADYPIGLQVGLRGGELLLPKGVLQGQKLGLILRELTLPVALINDFDQLPIPFRAVAADIVTGEKVELAGGVLALAIRASMSAPGIFAPIQIDGHALVDGGITGNVPVQTMRDLGVDIIIAVDVEFPLYGAEDLKTAVSISAQVLTILFQKETRRQLALLGENDILLRPELGLFGSGDFANIVDAIEPGALVAREAEDRLTRLSLDESEYIAYVAARRNPAAIETLDFVRVKNDGLLSASVLETRIESQAGDAVDTKKLAGDAGRLYGLELYDQVDYKIVEDGDVTGVEFQLRPKDHGPSFLQFGLQLEDDLEGDTSFNVAARLTKAGMNSLGAEWRTDFQLGTEPRLVTEFYQPLSFDARYFVAPHIGIEQRNFNVFLGDDNLAAYRVSDSRFGVDIGRELGLWGEVRLGLVRGVGASRLKVGSPDFPSSDFDIGGFLASFNVDTLDNAQIPLKGSRVVVQWFSSRTSLGADAQFDTLETSFTKAWTVGRHTFNGGIQFATSRDSEELKRNFFTLGGFLNLSGLARGEVSGPHVGLARLVYYRRSGEIKGSFDLPLYVGASLEAGNAWQTRSDISAASLLINSSIFMGADTFIGPVFLSAGFGEGGSRSLYLAFGNTPY